MKHAFLIIAHNEYQVLKCLLSMLDDERNDIFLHIDRRSKELYEQLSSFRMQKGKLNLLSLRLSVYWGDISQVEVEYLLLETASAKYNYAYYHLLSGTDLPIQTQNNIHDFFSKNNGKEFVSYWQSPEHQKDLKRKVSRYYFFTRHLKRNRTKWHALTAPCQNLILILQRAIRLERKQEMEFKKGAQWFSITHAFCQYLISQKAFVTRRFKYTLCPDEIFVQTILWNSPFRTNIYQLEDTGNMRLIDWKRGTPYTWRKEDYEELINSHLLFTRKFSDRQIDIVNLIASTYAAQ